VVAAGLPQRARTGNKGAPTEWVQTGLPSPSFPAPVSEIPEAREAMGHSRPPTAGCDDLLLERGLNCHFGSLPIWQTAEA